MKFMKIILLKDDKKLGKKNEIVEISDSYARNVLIPNGAAVQATKEAIAIRDAKIEKERRQFIEAIDAAKALKAKVDALEFITIKAEKTNNGRLFGSITNKDIAIALAEQHNINIDKKDILIEKQIKQLGDYVITIVYFGGESSKLNLKIVE